MRYITVPSRGGEFTARLVQTGRDIKVNEGETILDALRNAGLAVRSSCEQGVCGACETKVLDGVPEHNDLALTQRERAENKVVMLRCAGSKTDLLVLDM